MSALDKRIPPPFVMVLAALSVKLISSIGITISFPYTVKISLVLGLLLIGLILDLTALKLFLKSKTTINPFKPDSSSHLVTSGIYRYTRNPMYLGLLLILLSVVVHYANLLGFIPVALFTIYITRYQIVPEERAMQALFGNDFNDYCSQVRRWI